MLRIIKHLILLSIFAISNPATAGQLLFDGDFETAFQGWTPGGQNGGQAVLAARNTCFSGNDTTAISFNGNDPLNNFTALLRSGPGASVDSVATLRSNNFLAGNGIIFSALSETADGSRSDTPVSFSVRILDSEGGILAELPVQTAVIALTPGCPSTKRDAAFSVHYIDTKPFNGEISIEFTQHTNFEGLGFFTLIDNVVFVEKGEVFVNQTQPIAVAGTQLTTSNILFLDPRSSIDPDGLPSPLQFSWFIDGEENVRFFDLPCVNVNGDFTLGVGNHVATLYATDGVNYSADTLRFVVTSSFSGATDTTDGGDSGDGTGDGSGVNPNITLTTPRDGDIITPGVVAGDGLTGDGTTLTDPREECDIDVADALEDSAPPGADGVSENGDLSIDVDTSVEGIPSSTFTVNPGTPVNITGAVVDIQSVDSNSVDSIIVTIDSAVTGDSLSLSGEPATLNVAPNVTNTMITITPADANSPVSDEDYETALESILFEYEPEDENDINDTERTINYTASDDEEANNSVEVTSTVTIN